MVTVQIGCARFYSRNLCRLPMQNQVRAENLGKRKYVDRLKRLESLNLVSFSHKDIEGRTDLETAGRTLDLSAGGILLEIPALLPSTSEEVEITLGVRDDVIKARGKIIHQRELDSGNVGLGISFIGLSDKDSGIITRFLDED